MAMTFTLNAGDTTGHVFDVKRKRHGLPQRGDQLLVVERELKDPATGKRVGILLGHLTYMQVLCRDDTVDDALLLGVAEHRLNGGVIPAVKAGVISVQGSFRFSDEKPVFSIVGGTGAYEKARGTVTRRNVPEAFTYDLILSP